MVMREIARNALTHVLGAREGERLLVVTDEHRIEIGNAFYEAGDRLKLESRLFVLEDGERPLRELPHDLRRTLQGADMMVSVFVAYPEETPFRIVLLKAAAEAGARTGHGPGITDDMMLKGAMRVDFERLREAGEAMERRLEGATGAHLTSPSGTDLRFDLLGRRFISDVSVAPGSFGNFPNGEVRCAPLETGALGTLVCDSTVGDLGRVTSPVTIEVAAGRIASIGAEDPRLVARIEELTSIDEQASIVGELGIGINPAARVIGNMLEDEKAVGTVHVAFGNNTEMGGENTSRTHRDFLMTRPTLLMEFEDGRKEEIIRDGRLVE